MSHSKAIIMDYSLKNNQSKFALIQEMYEAVNIIELFDIQSTNFCAKTILENPKVCFTGEGSSRIFPAKRTVYESKKYRNIHAETETSLQVINFDMRYYNVIAGSYSGKTSETILLYNLLQNNSDVNLYCVSGNANSILFSLSQSGFVLTCGKEHAVAATKSVLETALVYHAILYMACDKPLPLLSNFALQFKEVLDTVINNKIIKTIASATTILWSGINNGVAEELRLKTNEIIRKKSDYLESGYILHGIEEVLDACTDVVILIEPAEELEKKIYDMIYLRLHIPIIAIANRQTLFPTLKIPMNIVYAEYLQIAAGWNILASAALYLGINMDKPERARKIGNEAN